MFQPGLCGGRQRGSDRLVVRSVCATEWTEHSCMDWFVPSEAAEGAKMKLELEIRKASPEDVEAVGEFYEAVCGYLQAHVNYPGWRKGIYPSRETAAEAVAEGSLYVALKERTIVGSMILRHRPETGYDTVRWKRELPYDRVLVIVTFAVHPDYSGQGIGGRMIDCAEELAGRQGIQSLRLDVAENNIPAARLYEKHGFEYLGNIDMGLEEIGLKWFMVYEKLMQ